MGGKGQGEWRNREMGVHIQVGHWEEGVKVGRLVSYLKLENSMLAPLGSRLFMRCCSSSLCMVSPWQWRQPRS